MTREIASTAAGQVRGTLNGQLALPFAGEKLGLGTYGKNGCGIIALYNALQLLGRPRPLGEIGADLVRRHRLLFGGLGGIGPRPIAAFFREQGIACAGSFSCRRLTESCGQGAVLVFTVMNARHPFRGFHTMAAQKDCGGFTVYNVGPYDSGSRRCASLRDAFPGGVFIRGFRVG